MSDNLDHVLPECLPEVPEPRTGREAADPSRVAGAEARGETITVRDFFGRVVDTIGVTAHGQFHTKNGIIAKGDLGQYVLRITGHPAGRG